MTTRRQLHLNAFLMTDHYVLACPTNSFTARRASAAASAG
jgi:hypothetical protein